MGSCFIAGTKVRLASGEDIPIEDVSIGDEVLGASGLNTVVAFDHPKLEDRNLYSFGGDPWVTAEHPFMSCTGRWCSIRPDETRDEWVDFDGDDLIATDWLVHESGPVHIDSITAHRSDPDTQLYNFVLSGDRTYFADGFLVHNKGGNDDQSNVISSSSSFPSVPKVNVFQQAGALQSTAATEGADAEIAALKQAIAQLQQMLGQGTGEFTEAGLGGLEGVVQGSTAQGFDDRLNSIIGGDSFNSIVDLRRQGVQGQLASGGLTRSGTAIDAASAIPADVALLLENQLFGRQAGLADVGFQSQTNDVNRQFGLNAQIAALLGGIGTSESAGIRGSAEAEAGGILGEKAFQFQKDQQRDQNKSDRNSALFGAIGTGVGAFFGGPVGAGIGGSIGSSFSDPRLKTNVKIAGKIGPLDLVTWDWIEEAKKTIVGNFRTIGFMSTQIKEHYPDLVSDYGGYDVIDYTGLMERLDG